MDYKKFKFNAVIDWLEIEIKTKKPTNFQTIKRHGELWYVEAMDETAGGAATCFKFKLHNPKNWQTVTETIGAIDLENPLIDEAKVIGIEVSFDAYSKTSTRKELEALTERFYRYLTKPVSNNHRFSGRKGIRADVERIDSTATLRRLIASGRNICIGNNADDKSGFNKYKADEQYMQIYFKTTDNNGMPVLESEYRARIEIRLRGQSLPYTKLHSWLEFKFEILSKYFNFRTLNKRLLSLAPAGFDKALDNISQIGSISGYKRRRRIHSLLTLPDKELNNKVYEALRCLTDRMQTTSTVR